MISSRLCASGEGTSNTRCRFWRVKSTRELNDRPPSPRGEPQQGCPSSPAGSPRGMRPPVHAGLRNFAVVTRGTPDPVRRAFNRLILPRLLVARNCWFAFAAVAATSECPSTPRMNQPANPSSRSCFRFSAVCGGSFSAYRFCSQGRVRCSTLCQWRAPTHKFSPSLTHGFYVLPGQVLIRL